MRVAAPVKGAQPDPDNADPQPAYVIAGIGLQNLEHRLGFSNLKLSNLRALDRHRTA